MYQLCKKKNKQQKTQTNLQTLNLSVGGKKVYVG